MGNWKIENKINENKISVYLVRMFFFLSLIAVYLYFLEARYGNDVSTKSSKLKKVLLTAKKKG